MRGLFRFLPFISRTYPDAIGFVERRLTMRAAAMLYATLRDEGASEVAEWFPDEGGREVWMDAGRDYLEAQR